MTLKLVRRNDQAVITTKAIVADHFWSRLKGLIGVRSLSEGEGLLLSDCNNIHMWMMSVSIDVVFLKRQNSESWLITKVIENLKPWKFLPVASASAQDTLELPADTIRRHDLKAGEVLCIA